MKSQDKGENLGTCGKASRECGSRWQNEGCPSLVVV